MRKSLSLVLAVAALAACAGAPRDTTAPSGQGEVVLREVRSSLPGIHAASAVSVYLPAGYAASRRAYPVLYLLHGTGGSNGTFLGLGYGPERLMSDADARTIVDRLVAQGQVKPLILVCPDMTKVDQDFLVRDLVPFVDRTFRAGRGRGSRAIAGHSSGGFDALSAVISHPDLFGVACGLASAGLEVMVFRLDDAVAQLREKDRAVRFWLYAGTADQYGLAPENRDFAEALRRHGLPVEYVEDDGDHINRVAKRLEELVRYCSSLLQQRHVVPVEYFQ